jgi:DNA-binding MarR family transcriptional regulator
MSHLATPEELRENPGYQLWLVTNAWQRSLRKVLQPLGLTHAQFAVLASVARLQGGTSCVTQSDVCRVGSLDPNMASEVVRSLQSKGLVVRGEHPTDRRAHRLLLTEAGEQMYHEGRKAVIPVKEAFFAPLGDDAKILAGMLEKLAQVNESESR